MGKIVVVCFFFVGYMYFFHILNGDYVLSLHYKCVPTLHLVSSVTIDHYDTVGDRERENVGKKSVIRKERTF